MTDILDQDATGQLQALVSREINAQELLSETYKRIKTCNPQINAVVSLIDEEQALDQLKRSPDGPLSGLPIAVKDLAETKDIRTTYGSPLFSNFIPDTDCPMVQRLKAGGAVVIGKTNTPEFGLGSHSYNPVHGVTRNPYDLSKSAGGSSGGAGAALATRMVALADGSDMMGSLRNPAGWNNVYGFRPSYGLVPKGGSGDLFLSQLSTEGPMARSVRDIELLLSVQAPFDRSSPHSIGPYNSTDTTQKLKIGWAGNWGGSYPMEEGVLDCCQNGLLLLQELGHTVSEIAPPFSADALFSAWGTLRSWVLAAQSKHHYENPSERDQLKPEMIWEIETGLSQTAMDIHAASQTRSDWFRTTASMDVDVIALPSAQCFPFPADWDWPREIAGQSMDTYHRWMEAVVPASLTGLPALSVPTGFSKDGLPIGLQLIAHRRRDAELLALGRAYDAVQSWTAIEPDLSDRSG